jgi:IS5 family transposase
LNGPVIGHMKSDGLLHRNYLKGREGDAINVILCAAGQNLRLILRHLRIYWLKISSMWQLDRSATGLTAA